MKKYIPLIDKTLNGILNNLIGEFIRCVPMVILYEYLIAWPLYDGGASLGMTSLYKTKFF